MRQYDDLSDEWWRPNGLFTMLHWLAAARAALVPPAGPDGGVLVDLGCGGGLLAPHVAALGYRHVGVDLVPSALAIARAHGVTPVRGDVTRIPLGDGVAAVVTAGELLEHVPDPAAVIAEAARVLRPGGRLVLDTLNRTALARLIVVTVGERWPGGRLRGIHDPALFVPPRVLVDACARHGIRLAVRGVRPSVVGVLRWVTGHQGPVPIVPTWTKAVLYQGVGVKRSGPDREA